MSQNVLCVGPTTDLQSAVKLMTEKTWEAFWSSRTTNYIGILTYTNIAKKVLAKDLDPRKTRVEEIMSYPISSLDEEAPLEQAQEMIGERQIRHLLVTRNGQAVGMISVRNLLDSVYDWMLRVKRDAEKR